MSASDPSSAPPPVVLITGAAGGLGTSLASAFASSQWRVAVSRHLQEPAVPAGTEVQVVPLDVTQADSIEAAVLLIKERWGRIDVLVNNAGTLADGLSWHLSEEDWERVLSVNLKGAFLCARAVLPLMLRQRQGHIVNVGSFSGRVGQRGQANYAAAKAGLIGLTQSLAKEVGSRNVRANVVLPGVLLTAMTAPLGETRLAEFAAANALGRLNSAAEVARFVVFLAGLSNVSGQVFQLDSRIAPWT